MFKGLATSGAWSCFDEFNRIQLEVLSVIAQQISNIQEAKRQRLSRLNIDGRTVRLKMSCNIFITMNPGYAGRSELPDNLKTLFRPCAMMVPDYALIAEIRLFSVGFSQARQHARKVVQVLRLSSEQLSKQKHYDYGMRAVNSTLQKAGIVRAKLASAGWSEEQIILRSIHDVNISKFVSSDLSLFSGITRDLFPSTNLPSVQYRLLKAEIVRAAKLDFHISPSPHFETQCTQLYETLCVRHGTMLIGMAGSGKSSCLRTLQTAIFRRNQIFSQMPPEDKEVHSTEMLDLPSPVKGNINKISINPRSVSIEELFGHFDKHTAEWDDGLVPMIFRQMVNSTDCGEWLLFDGPVSTLWIESLNTVLDDNKKLCLMSGEIIKMSNCMTMIFETDALDNASPATVSRCGMVYLSPSQIGWLPILESFFLHRFPFKIHSTVAKMHFLRTLVPDIVSMLLAGSKIPDLEKMDPDAIRLQLYNNFLTIWESFIRIFMQADEGDQRNTEELVNILENTALFSLVYGIGGVLDFGSQGGFSSKFRSALPSKLAGCIPPQGSVFDYCFHVHSTSWSRWEDMLPLTSSTTVPSPICLSNQLFVSTVDSVRTSHIVRFLLEAGRHVLLSGETGTGKSVLIGRILREWKARARFGHEESEDDYDDAVNQGAGASDIGRDLIRFGFSFSSSPSQLKESIERELVVVGRGMTTDSGVKTFKANTMVPKGMRLEMQRQNISLETSASCVVCIDDFNLPAKKEGAQPPVEVIREWMDHDKWYVCKAHEVVAVTTKGIVFAGVMGHPGGGRSQISQRLSRHFQMLTVHLDQTSQTRIFTALMERHFNGHATSVDFIRLLVACSVNLYASLAQNLRPTPLKSHYTFNLRDLCSVFRGVLSVPSNAIQSTSEGVLKLARLWTHETTRVFHDRLVDDTDRSLFFTLLQQATQSCCCYEGEGAFTASTTKGNEGCSRKLIVQPTTLRPLLETDAYVLAQFFRSPEINEQAMGIWGRFRLDGAQIPDYLHIDSHRCDELIELLYSTQSAILEERDNQGFLILHQYAIRHITRINRVLWQDRGNALLIGMGGNGRRSLAKLSARVAGHSLFQIKNDGNYGLTEWKEDLKRVLIAAGDSETSNLVFVIDGSSIEHDFILEDLSSVLNGNFDFFDYEEKSSILEKLLLQMEALEKADGCMSGMPGNEKEATVVSSYDVWDFYTSRLQCNLHLVFCISQIGSQLREWARRFPSLISCCYVDFFSSWSVEALQSVAHHKLEKNIFKNNGCHDYIREGGNLEIDPTQCIVDSCIGIHLDMSRHFDGGDAFFVTPSHFLHFLDNFQKTQLQITGKCERSRGKYLKGLNKLDETSQNVDELRLSLEQMQPQLEVLTVETTRLMGILKKEEQEAKSQREIVDRETSVCAETEQIAKVLKEECEADLAKALPLLEDALSALDALKKDDVYEIKSMKRPPVGVRLTMEAIGILMKVKPDRNLQLDGTRTEDYWVPAKKTLLSDVQLLDKLKKFDKDNISQHVFAKVSPYVVNEQFQPRVITRQSKAAGGMCKWVHAMVTYSQISSLVGPKKDKLESANLELEQATSELEVKLEQLKCAEEKVKKLQEEFQVALEKRESLLAKTLECRQKIERATRLMSSMEEEKVQWTEYGYEQSEKLTHSLGDALLTAGFISYLGILDAQEREKRLTRWTALLDSSHITVQESFSLLDMIGDANVMRMDRDAQLPNDLISKQNAIILRQTTKWPLMIDP